MTLIILTAVATAVVVFLVVYRILDRLTRPHAERFGGGVATTRAESELADFYQKSMG